MSAGRDRTLFGVFIGLWLLFAFAVSMAPVARASESSVEHVREALEQFLRTGAAAAGSDIEFEIELPPLASFDIDASRHADELRTELSSRADKPYKGRVPVNVALYSGDRLLHRGIVSPYLRVSREVVVARRDLSRGTVLTPEDVVLASKDESRLPRDVLVESSDAIGLRLRRSVRRGNAFRAGQVESVPLVERGDRVMLVLESGGLLLQAAGQAKQKGAIGDWIRVVNLDSKREILGRIDHEGKVHVAY